MKKTKNKSKLDFGSPPSDTVVKHIQSGGVLGEFLVLLTHEGFFQPTNPLENHISLFFRLQLFVCLSCRLSMPMEGNG